MASVPNEKRARHKEARRQKIEQERRQAKRQQLLRRIGYGIIAAVVVVGSVILINMNNSTSLVSTTTTSSTTTSTLAPGDTTTTVKGASTQAEADARAIASGCPSSTTTRVNTMSWSSEPAVTINTQVDYMADFVTTAGNFTVKLDAAAAPHMVNSFVFLAKKGYFHCVIFHRVIPGFMAQTGDPTGSGTGGPGYTLPDENFPASGSMYPLYSVAMANTGSAHTGGSQFFINTGTAGESLPHSYSLFGQVVSGQTTLIKINADGDSTTQAGTSPAITHRILSVTIHTN